MCVCVYVCVCVCVCVQGFMHTWLFLLVQYSMVSIVQYSTLSTCTLQCILLYCSYILAFAVHVHIYFSELWDSSMAHGIVIVLLHCVFSDYCYCLFTVHLCSCACTHVLHVLCPVMFVYMYICILFNYMYMYILYLYYRF